MCGVGRWMGQGGVRLLYSLFSWKFRDSASWGHAIQSLGDDAQGFCSTQLFRDPRQL